MWPKIQQHLNRGTLLSLSAPLTLPFVPFWPADLQASEGRKVLDAGSSDFIERSRVRFCQGPDMMVLEIQSIQFHHGLPLPPPSPLVLLLLTSFTFQVATTFSPGNHGNEPPPWAAGSAASVILVVKALKKMAPY